MNHNTENKVRYKNNPLYFQLENCQNVVIPERMLPVVWTLMENPGITRIELAEKCDISAVSLRRFLCKLYANNLVSTTESRIRGACTITHWTWCGGGINEDTIANVSCALTRSNNVSFFSDSVLILANGRYYYASTETYNVLQQIVEQSKHGIDGLHGTCDLKTYRYDIYEIFGRFVANDLLTVEYVGRRVKRVLWKKHALLFCKFINLSNRRK